MKMSFLKIIGMVFFLHTVSVSTAPTDLEKIPKMDQEMLKEIMGLLLKVHSLLDLNLNDSDWQNVNLACRCEGTQCSCCHRIQVPKIWLNKEFCVSVEYLRDSSALVICLKVDGSEIFRKELSAKRPIPICLHLHSLCPGAKVCVQLSNVNFSGRRLHSCIALTAKLFFFQVAKIDVGCFYIPFLDENGPINNLEMQHYASPNLIQNQQNVPFQPFPNEDIDIAM